MSFQPVKSLDTGRLSMTEVGRKIERREMFLNHLSAFDFSASNTALLVFVEEC